MRKYIFAFMISALCLGITGCRSSKNASSNQNEVWQTLLVKQIDAQVQDQIITVKYNNGTTLCYKILDNFGNVTLTWDRTGGRSSFDDGPSNYKGDISIPSFITTGQDNDFTFRVMEIDQNAFYNCSEVTSIDIPFSVLRIVNDAFKGCSGVKRYTVNENNQSYKDVDGVLFSKDNKMLIKYPAKKQLTDYVISEDVSLICTEAFTDNTYLKKVYVGNFVTAISDFAFMNCTSLEEVELGGNVRIIGAQAFKNCPKLALINSHGIFPPHNSPTVFDDVVKQNAKLYVPKGQLNNYRRRLEWRDFKNVQEY
ncbi:MAG: leucine-rich repeat domain-containing protein [Bacteroidaceae bacterium]|nr:leucine-rich repeat domain-containing protein [Bacteroidaceae bacterium]